MKYLTRPALLELMKDKTDVLLVGNHVEPSGVQVSPREFSIVMNGNSNKLEHPDMLASFTEFAGECPHRYRLYANDKAKGDGFLLTDEVAGLAQRALGLQFTDGHAIPTIGFTLFIMLDRMCVPFRMAGFSWYRAPGDLRGRSHRPDKECDHIKRAQVGNYLLTMTEETLRWL